jgi:hypothetical protein
MVCIFDNTLYNWVISIKFIMLAHVITILICFPVVHVSNLGLNTGNLD